MSISKENIDFKECLICFSQINNECYSLQCKHEYHINCLSEWLKRASNCPTCRLHVEENRNIFPNYDGIKKLGCNWQSRENNLFNHYSGSLILNDSSINVNSDELRSGWSQNFNESRRIEIQNLQNLFVSVQSLNLESFNENRRIEIQNLQNLFVSVQSLNLESFN
jgi:hypothetical protein